MHRYDSVFLLAALAISFTGHCSSASTVFEQAPDVGSGRASDFGFREDGNETAEDFVLAAPAVLRSINWYGGHDFGSTEIPDNDAFTVSFYSDAGGVPASTPFASYLIGADTDRTDTGFDYSFGSDQLMYSANLPETALLSGTTYYLSIVADTRGTTAGAWFWGSSGDGAPSEWSRSVVGVGPWGMPDFSNRAFSLSDARLVPEASTMTLCLVASWASACLTARRP